MTSRTVDVVAASPPSLDPYDPAATAWALAAGFAVGGADVVVYYPAGAPGADPPAGVRGEAVPLTLRRPGAAIEAAELASAAGKRLRSEVDLVVRDPSGLGRLGVRRGRRNGPVVAAFVHDVELAAFDQERTSRPLVGWRDRIDLWRDRRAVRRLEESALREADRLFYDAPRLPNALRDAYGIPTDRCRPLPPPVPVVPAPPTREEARADFHIPMDVPVVVAPAPFEDPERSGTDRAREAFRRVRSFFPGARLIVAGTQAPAEPGVVLAPERNTATLVRALVAADVAFFDRRVPGFDPGAVLAMRAGLAVILGPGVRLPLDPSAGVRELTSDDPGDAASTLAELLADPAARRPLAAAAATLAARFEPTAAAEAVITGVRLGAS